MYPRRKGRLSPREQAEQIKSAHRGIATLITDPVKRAEYERLYCAPLPPKRTMVRRPVERTVPLESSVNDDIYDAFKKRADVRLWRNNRGVATYGNQQVAYGVGPRGASDWIGYRRVLIKPEHVGLTIAQFVALEAKRPGEKPDEDQQKFIDRVNSDGGHAGWADSGEKAKELLP